jgi:outer membrane lipoprotein carrier protein
MKLKNVFALWLMVLSVWTISAHAATNPQDQLADYLSDLQATEGYFTQVIYSHRGQALQTTSGTFALLRPGKFRWQTLTPTAQLLVADGRKVWLYDEGLNQVSWFKEEVNNKQSPAVLLVGDIDGLAQQYRIGVVQTQSRAVFSLKPRHDSFFEEVSLVFEDEMLSDMAITDNLGQITRIHFSDLSDDASADLFQFKPAKGVDVVEAAM